MLRLALCLLVCAALTASADWCEPTTADPLVEVGAGELRYYITYDCPPWGGAECTSAWVYEESNGIVGLQRNDEVVDNTCNGQIPADAAITPETN